MLTKPPDYMISECGCPELWPSSETKHLAFTKMNSKFWNTYTSWCSTKSSQLTKLLPLRESWTDYYTRNHLQKQSAEKTQAKYNRLPTSTSTSMSSSASASTYTSNNKQQKNHHNESTKRRSFHYNNKRFTDATTSNMDTPQRRSRTKHVDSELDQF